MQGSPILTLDNASKHFGAIAAFEGVSFSLQRGEVLGLAGPNGGGKTSLLRCIVGIYACDKAGSVAYGLEYTGAMSLRRQVAYAPDDDGLIEELTGLEYLEFVADVYELELRPAIERAEEILSTLRLDLTSLKRLIRSYSHGMRKKLQLAAVLMVRVPLTIVDEPTNGLDPSTVILTKQLLRDAARHGAVIFSSHNLSFAEDIADRVILLNNHVLAEGTLREVLRKSKAKNLESAYKTRVMKAYAGSDTH